MFILNDNHEDRLKPSLSYSRSLRNMTKEFTHEPEEMLTNVVKNSESSEREVLDIMLDSLFFYSLILTF